MALDFKQAFEDMSAEHNQTPIPKEIKGFLLRHFDARQFEDRKKVYMLMRMKKQNTFLKHLAQCYALIHFWRHMFLNMVEQSDHSLSLMQKSLEAFIEKMVHKTGDEERLDDVLDELFERSHVHTEPEVAVTFLSK